MVPTHRPSGALPSWRPAARAEPCQPAARGAGPKKSPGHLQPPGPPVIFRPELARKIIRGEKTMTRRPIKPGETTCRYRPGRDYAVQPGRGNVLGVRE